MRIVSLNVPKILSLKSPVGFLGSTKSTVWHMYIRICEYFMLYLKFCHLLFVLFHGTSSVFSNKCFSSNIISTTAANTQNTKSPPRFINRSRLRRSFDFCLATTRVTTALDFSLVEFSMSESVHSPSVL